VRGSGAMPGVGCQVCGGGEVGGVADCEENASDGPDPMSGMATSDLVNCQAAASSVWWARSWPSVRLDRCRSVTIAAGAAPVVVVLGRAWPGDGGEGPEEADGVEPVVLTMRRVVAMLRPEALVRCGSDVGLEHAGVGEAGSVVTDLGEEPGAAEISRAGKAREHVVVVVLGERLDSGLADLIGVVALGVQTSGSCRI
jgi:hypothetical protein